METINQNLENLKLEREKKSSKVLSKSIRIPQKNQPELNLTRVCPKCGTVNRGRANECTSCAVIFSKIEGLPLDPKLKIRPSFLKAWETVIGHFESRSHHDEFVRYCWREGVLSFALQKYLEFLEAQPHDPMAKEMKEKVLKMHEVDSFLSEPKDIVTFRVNLKKLWSYGSVIFSFCLIFLGFGVESMRNLVGIGAALLFLSMGLFFYFYQEVRKP